MNHIALLLAAVAIGLGFFHSQALAIAPPASSICVIVPAFCEDRPTVEPSIDSFAKTTSTARVSPGELATFTLSYAAKKNDGRYDSRPCRFGSRFFGGLRYNVSWIEIEDKLPAGFSFDSAIPTPSFCPLAASTLLWRSDAVDPSDSKAAAGTITLKARAGASVCSQNPSGSATNNATITVYKSGGGLTTTAKSSSVTLNCNPRATLTSINPNQGNQGATVNVTLTGTNFSAGPTINAGNGITVSNTTFVSATQITATFAIAATAALGPRNITATMDGVTTNPVTFTVNTASSGSAPTLSGIVPNSGSPGCTVNVTLNGTNFAAGATITAGSGIAVSNINVVSATQITATFTIASTATLGGYDVRVTVGGLTSNPVTFTVTTGACGGGGGGPPATSCSLLVCFSYDAKVIILPPPGFTRIIKPFISEVAP
ncbi:MAG: IPT/TIG domain-containing protein [Patescibacteria group bacterium]